MTGSFITITIVLMWCYVFTLHIITQYGEELFSTTLVTVPILAIMAAVLTFDKKRYARRLINWRIPGKDLKISFIEGIAFSLPVFILLVAAKYLLLRHHPDFSHHRLFDLNSQSRLSLRGLIVEGMLYTAFVPLQEYIRSICIQHSFYKILPAGNKWKPVILTSLLFSILHLHISTWIALLVVFLGSFWGWLFLRQGNLLGVITSHIIIGFLSIYVIGFPSLM